MNTRYMEIVGVEDGTLILDPSSTNSTNSTTTTTTSSSRYTKSKAMKEKGNLLLVKMKRTFEALRVYTEAIDCLTEGGTKNQPEDSNSRQLLIDLYSNCALALLREKDAESAIVLCDQAIELSSTLSYKAMYRKGQALKLLGRTAESKTWLKRARALKP
jgi:tetratricopeptide (TPR) repeat protein